MSVLTVIMLVFSVIGALDRIFGCRLGIGKEYERAFMLLGPMALSMIGMIVISPLIADVMRPVSEFTYEVLHIDASIIPASLFANDMGGASLSVDMAKDLDIGLYNALVVSSMMGCTVSFTVPFALGVVGKEQHRELLLGLLCGIITIPAGCLVAGFICGISFVELIVNLIPLIVFSIVLAIGVVKLPDLSVKIFKVVGFLITALITVGLTLGVIEALLKTELIPVLAPIEEGGLVCLNAAIVLSGAFPLVNVVSRLLARPLRFVGAKIGINEISVVGMVSALASSATSFGVMNRMDKRGTTLNAAFSVSGAFILGSHLAFTMAFNPDYVLPVIVGKLVSGVLAVVLAYFVYSKSEDREG